MCNTTTFKNNVVIGRDNFDALYAYAQQVIDPVVMRTHFYIDATTLIMLLMQANKFDKQEFDFNGALVTTL